MHEVLVNRLGGLSLPRKSVVRLTDRSDMTLDVYRGRKTTIQQQQLKYTHLTSVLNRRFCRFRCGQIHIKVREATKNWNSFVGKIHVAAEASLDNLEKMHPFSNSAELEDSHMKFTGYGH